MSGDIYDRHRRNVEIWREACQNVEFAKKQRDEARAALDAITIELTNMFKPAKRDKPVNKRGRKAKVNGAVATNSMHSEQFVRQAQN